MPFRSVPGQASVASEVEGGKLFAPSAARNLAPLVDLVIREAPRNGRALEIASGTGQHIVGLARALPGLHWHPSDIDPARRASIDAYVAEAGLKNVEIAAALDATGPGWGALIGPFDLILLSNLLHLISGEEARLLLEQAAMALTPAGRMVIYGPFARGGTLTSEGDRAFDAALRDHDPETGYKDVAEMHEWATDVGLSLTKQIEMPANNLSLVLTRSSHRQPGQTDRAD
ncbi:DUF938 domain-containing protein [Tritonibacter horizontis]|uniref:Methyltransferase domain protein n=1 Tax=Tritonibacter horizontis TaxID=1768241 RepID=A0A132BXR8_9RHOB|nr:DUF938 domain-containing protein [Tritonibacter horizontis]KUP93181.1 methyltransferase domain protein [Tritonibacter horizontis]